MLIDTKRGSGQFLTKKQQIFLTKFLEKTKAKISRNFR